MYNTYIEIEWSISWRVLSLIEMPYDEWYILRYLKGLVYFLNVFNGFWRLACCVALLACRASLPCGLAVLACRAGLPCWLAVLGLLFFISSNFLSRPNVSQWGHYGCHYCEATFATFKVFEQHVTDNHLSSYDSDSETDCDNETVVPRKKECNNLYTLKEYLKMS